MPKKTRRQKKLADKHRVVISQNVHEAIIVSPPTVEIVIDEPQRVEKKYAASEYDMLLTAHTIADLKKTFLITASLFALEFIFFYAKLKGII